MDRTAKENSKSPRVTADASNPTIKLDVEPSDIKPPAPHDDMSRYPQGIKLATILACVFSVVFIVALVFFSPDRTIIGTAAPKITDKFHSINDIGWYASAFLLPGCAFMLIFGKLYQFYPVKIVYLTCILIFEIGSAICGAAPTSAVLILGRAIAGLGGAGLFSGTVVIMVHTIPLQKRPAFQGAFGAVFGLASVVGPLLGGAFTDHVSWRWCFYINLPIGAVVVVALIFLLHIPSHQRPPNPGAPNKPDTLARQIQRLDPIGTLLFLPGTTCLLLALQWGGTEYSWSSGRVIVCLVLAGVLLLGFIGVQVCKGDAATVPPRIVKQRSVASAVWYAFFIGCSMMTTVFYVPIWFQAIQGTSAIDAGIRTLALILPLVIASILAGQLTFRTGYYVPQMLIGSTILCIGAGLLTTWTVDVERAKWIGYQILYGFGLGFGMQQPNMAIQTVLERRDIPTGTSLIIFSQFLGASTAVSIAQNIFASRFQQYLTHIQGVDVASVTRAGATGLRYVVSKDELQQVLVVYNRALTKTFIVAVVASCLGMFGAITMEWRSIKKGEGQAGQKQKQEGSKENCADKEIEKAVERE